MPGRAQGVTPEEPTAGNLHGGVREGGEPRQAMVDLSGHEAGNGGYSQRKPTAHRVSSTRKVRAAMLVAVLAGESPAGGNCSVATVVISGSGASDQAAGSPEVKVSVGWRETFGQLRQGGERVGRL